ncbi:tricarballylate utilization 4Fe-4S protein TcuB [Burkholderia multivorans]|uniref:Tricarballylate utilization 4Fe-4S protein TcuB n=1 Tax=Burkholderia multivorans TaxID=87883 RepID=A0AAP2MMC2_9BURK|nr:tricarballylate utilization 4Fe-4S protein TcuB [Burkholderia multivorans]MBH9664521.1 tricarballylate utilization 4Fe-4S protein TcuB [Burkholderia multivorans]MBU9356145.1 tricarballylate utilization 4Fe-4S protein TcuB [Burkholderia multivorans]MBU9366606.1 tricarballylate utilization 4Fe-4S protein TcuB [Burkholderia multivorans]MBU9597115.1 tricarballylate utilization 4Fe-4S protein TcuB [Burkholderia multivorans]MBU9651177.1 tricarballylate utilization 4Fe-4S protein TcuB [Burkholderi
MQSLEALTREAAALAGNEVVARTDLTDAEQEVSRIMQICNACRYCEGFCAVFPAMTRRLEFGRADVHFLSNLCHNCGACLHACQYAPPHEFAVNVPQATAKVRVTTYTEYAWPASFGALYRNNGTTVALALAAGLALFLALAAVAGRPQPGSANFYGVFSHNLLVVIFGTVFIAAGVALFVGVRKFWKNESPGAVSIDAAADATASALTLRYLGGGHGEGCNNESDSYSLSRRRFHHLTFYGFMLCFASTCVATLYHYLFALEAPYGWTSLPVFLGSLGGMSLVVGCSGLLVLNLKRHPLHGDASQKGMDRGFIALLWLTGASGLALLGIRDTVAMPILLAVHLGIVLALFLTLPYGKFAHGIYRSAALLKWAVEKRKPSALMVEE